LPDAIIVVGAGLVPARVEWLPVKLTITLPL
jgi:hypothetical protein